MHLISRKITGIILSVFAGILCLNAPVFAKNVSVELQLDRQMVEVGDMLQIGLYIENEQNVPAPQIDNIDGFKIQYLGPSTKVSIINGALTSSITHRYRLVAMKTGIFTLGPFSFTYKGNNYATQTKDIEVVDRGQGMRQNDLSPGQQPVGNNLSGKIFLNLVTDKNNAYVNERIAVTIQLYVSRLSVRDIQYPIFEGQGFLKEDFGPPRQYKKSLGNELYDVVAFQTWLYPTKSGKVSIGPAKIKCNIVSRTQRSQGRRGLESFFDDSLFSDFFNRLQVYPKEVISDELSLDVMALPDKDRPQNFSGAVGDFTMKVKAAPLKLKAGDPITLNMKISGAGNFDSVQSPEIASEEKFKIYAAQVSKEEAGIKRFEQVIIPLDKSIINIPEIVFCFFNPKNKEYIMLKQPHIAIQVEAADEQGVKVIEGRSLVHGAAPTHVLGTDIVYIKEDIGRIRAKGKKIYSNRWFLIIQLFGFMLLCAAFIFQKQRERLSTDISYARKLRAPKVAREKIKKAKEYLAANKAKEFYDALFKTLQEYLGHRFNRPSAGITAEVIEDLIKAEGLDAEVASKLKSCFSECDSARYAIVRLDNVQMRKTMAVLEQAIDYLERHKL